VGCAEELPHAMGNTLSASNALFATYVPVNQATLRAVLEAHVQRSKKHRYSITSSVRVSSYT